MAYDWKEVEDALVQNDAERIAAYKADILRLMRDNAMRKYLEGYAIQSVFAAGLSSAMLKSQTDSQNIIVQFKLELLKEFASEHGLTTYTDAAQIQPGDTVAIKWKHKGETNLSHFRVFAKQDSQWLVSLSLWENDEIQFEAHKITKAINNRNFVVGVRQRKPPMMRRPHRFFFFKFNE